MLSAGGGPAAAGSAPGRSRGRTVGWGAAALVVVLVVVGLIVIHRAAEGYYAFSPGTAPRIVSDPSCRSDVATGELLLPDGSPCANLTVPGDKAHPLDGKLFMVDVLVGPADAEQYVLDKLGLLSDLKAGTQLVPASEVLGPTPAAQLICTDDQEAVSATESASVAALRRVGYQVKQNNLGAQVDTVSPGTPAARAGMKCNDVITAIDGQAVHTLADLQRILAAAHPGQVATIVVQRPTSGGKTQAVTLHTTLRGTPAQDGEPAAPTHAFLGILTESKVTFSLPFKVDIDVGDIGGPSDGLALTLGLLDLLTNGKLVAGHEVAATGTMDPAGDVGDVGGVAQKTVAVQRAGAQLFLVPPQELAVAGRGAGCRAGTTRVDGRTAPVEVCPHMQVKAVSTLTQALQALAAIGGQVGKLATQPS
jgi:PDZ domain-containing protein